MPRSPFEFLDSGTPERKLLLLLLAIIRKAGGQMELSLEDLTAVSEGDSFWKYPADSGSSLMLRFARKGAEAYFLAETDASETKRTVPPKAQAIPAPQPGVSQPPPPPRHALHDDLDYALREEEMARVAAEATRKRNREARAESGVVPWRNVKPQ